MTSKTPNTKTLSAKERAYEAIRDAIVNWELQPGEPLFEEALASKLNVSRTPIREALLLLSQENFVRIVPGRGAFVAEITAKEIVDIYQMRQALEALAARLVASRDDIPGEFETLLQEFDKAPQLVDQGDERAYNDLARRMDELIVKTAGNDLLRNTLEGLWRQSAWVRPLGRRELVLETVDEDKEILRAILERKPDRAAELVASHLERSLNLGFSFVGVGASTDVVQR